MTNSFVFTHLIIMAGKYLLWKLLISNNDHSTNYNLNKPIFH